VIVLISSDRNGLNSQGQIHSGVRNWRLAIAVWKIV
jgi:hypothetical protein